MSKKRVIDAASLLPVLKTLVAPIFPDPIFLISPSLKNFVINKDLIENFVNNNHFENLLINLTKINPYDV